VTSIDEEWRRDAERESLIAEFKQRIAEVRPHTKAAYDIWDRYCTELVRLERALNQLMNVDESLVGCQPELGRRVKEKS
jgi:hypothetical protein